MILNNNLRAIVFLILCLIGSCKTISTTESKQNEFISIDDNHIYADEFIHVFTKNNFKDSVPTQQAIDEYLDLFINFKLKVTEAKSLGLHNTSEFIQEFQTYRDELAKPYLTENIVNDQLVKEAYERMKTEVKASHILVLADENLSPQDTLKAYNKISDIRGKALSGEDFDQLAKEFSEDPSARTNGGNLGYFTAFQMVYPFEEHAYKTNSGDISSIFKTKFGYHILKVHDKRPSRGKIRTSHIMIRTPEGTSSEDSLAAVRKINEIHAKLNNGALWFDMCQQFSDDLNTKANGGLLPWFGSGNMVPEFEEAAFGIKDIGDFTKPIRTAYGWHIIKLEERKGLEPFEEIEENIKNLVKRDSRSQLSKNAFVERLKRENNFTENQDMLEELLSFSSNDIYAEFSENKENINQELFRINDSIFNIKHFLDDTKEKYPNHQDQVTSRLELWYNDFVVEKLVAYEKAQLAEKYYDYKMLLTEYEEGILLFQLMDSKVWTKAMADTIGLQAYFVNHLENYQWGERLDAVIYNAASEEIRNKIKPYLENDFITIPSSGHIVNFARNSSQLSNIDRNKLKNIAAILEKNEDWMLQITPENSELNQERVDSIMNYLGELEVSLNRIKISKEQSSESISLSLISTSRNSLEKYFNTESGLELKVESGLYEKDEHPLLKNILWQKGKYEINTGDRYHLIEVRGILPPAPKNIEDIKGLVISDYQNYLEQEWLKELKAKYAIKINDKEKRKIYRKLLEI